eukprot:CAMPEP_0170170220 /NCGR_PEP_ID=MMETSP0040_2-20121228/3165_1 /TAXON_ID=641309 /ORGANISM="Lotharella oceanica, Strain CCMP622" /LENGTH=119 /DNA_ID=CAMNT_0010409451 /DNA_START=35 /DNA_END=394 /DNA_ORIENTATION=-
MDWVAAKYCPLSYFGPKDPHKGSEDAKAEYKGVTYYLTNADVVKMFQADPEKFLPQFGGYCAMGMAHGKLTPVSPDNYKIIDGKLYLFLGEPDTKAPFEKDQEKNLKTAIDNWTKGNYK